MLGRLIYQLRSRGRHGLSAWWYRDFVRPRILSSSPITDLVDDRCEIHVLTSHDDFLNLLWALKSFYHATDRRYALAIHDDGTLSDSQQSQLQKHFPDARLIERSRADAEVIPALEDFPRCQNFRQCNHLSPKVFDFRHYLQSDRMLLLDSDVLFFAEPTELIRRIEDCGYEKNTVNGDVASAYTVRPEDVQKQFGFTPVDRFNSGLGLIHRDSLNLDWIEEFLGLPNVDSHFWRIEQTIFALCSSRYGTELLPKEYNVFLEGSLNGQPSRHYVGAIRHEMYREGIRKLRSEGFLKS